MRVSRSAIAYLQQLTLDNTNKTRKFAAVMKNHQARIARCESLLDDKVAHLEAVVAELKRELAECKGKQWK